VDEEQFGHALPVIRYTDPDDAIKRVNATYQGLAGSVWSGSNEPANAVAAQLEAGIIWVNKHADINISTPFEGAKQSGLGSELGADALHEHTQRKIINGNKDAVS